MLDLSCKGLSAVVVAPGSRPEAVVHLDVSVNSLKSGASLGPFTGLRTLVLDENEVQSVAQFPELRNLDTLSLNKNRIESLQDFLDSAVNLFPNIKNISLLKNPCNPFFESEEAYEDYKRKVVERFPGLISLDGMALELLRKKELKAESLQRLFGEVSQVKQEEGVKNVKIRTEGNRFVKNEHL